MTLYIFTWYQFKKRYQKVVSKLKFKIIPQKYPNFDTNTNTSTNTSVLDISMREHFFQYN